jgi:hypothetical protein
MKNAAAVRKLAKEVCPRPPNISIEGLANRPPKTMQTPWSCIAQPTQHNGMAKREKNHGGTITV